MSRILCVTGASGDVGKCLIERIAGNYDTVVCHYRSGATVIEDSIPGIYKDLI